MSNRLERSIFKSTAAAYYFSTHYFTKGVRDDVFKLYSFLKITSDYVQQPKPNVAKFEYIEHRWQTIKIDLQKRIVPTPLDDSVDERVLANVAYIVHRYFCDALWIDAYLQSMRYNMQNHTYRGNSATLQYVYGSAEVIALCMARILNMPEEALRPVRMQGRAIQYINMLRSIPDDNAVGRCYFAVSELKKHGLKDLSEAEARGKPAMFTEFVHAQLLQYATWQTQANHGILYVTKHYRAPLLAVIESYSKVANQIKNDPFAIYNHTLQLKKQAVIKTVFKRSIGR